MRQIIQFFINPEISMHELIMTYGKEERKEGLVKSLKIIILIGLLTVISYKLLGIQLDELVKAMSINLIDLGGLNEGMRSLATAFIQIIGIGLISGIRIVVWIGLLFIANYLLKGCMGIRQLSNIAIYTQITWLTIKLLHSIALILFVLVPIEGIYQVINNILMMLEYWYLILLGIGVAIGCRTTLFKSGLFICIVQLILWGIAKTSPILQWIFE